MIEVWWFVLTLTFANGSTQETRYEFPNNHTRCEEVREALLEGCRVGDVTGVEATSCKVFLDK